MSMKNNWPTTVEELVDEAKGLRTGTTSTPSARGASLSRARVSRELTEPTIWLASFSTEWQ